MTCTSSSGLLAFLLKAFARQLSIYISRNVICVLVSSLSLPNHQIRHVAWRSPLGHSALEEPYKASLSVPISMIAILKSFVLESVSRPGPAGQVLAGSHLLLIPLRREVLQASR